MNESFYNGERHDLPDPNFAVLLFFQKRSLTSAITTNSTLSKLCRVTLRVFFQKRSLTSTINTNSTLSKLCRVTLRGIKFMHV